MVGIFIIYIKIDETMKINSFGLCLALDMNHKIYEKRIEGLIERLQTDPEFKDLPATQNCLSLMKRIGNGYGRTSALTYFYSARLLYNLEALMTRFMSETEGDIYIEIDRLKSILYEGAEKPYTEKVGEPAIDQEKIKVRVGSRYFSHLLHADFTEKEIAKIRDKVELAAVGLPKFKAKLSMMDASAIICELNEYQPREISDDLRQAGSFKKLICSLNYECTGSYEPHELRKTYDPLIKARNSISHKGTILLDGDKLENILKPAFTYLALAANHTAKPKFRFLNVIKYCITNPIDGIRYCLPGLMAILIILLLTWAFAPMPKPQRMTYPLEGVGGQMERLFEGFARQDTTTVLDIYDKANIIIETTEAIK